MRKSLLSATSPDAVLADTGDAEPIDLRLLVGEMAICYMRYSAAQQGRGSSIERQETAIREILRKYGMTADPAFNIRDEGAPASTGHHRKFGNLKKFLALLGLNPDGSRIVMPDGSYKASELPRGKNLRQRVLLIESIDRLVRERLSVSHTLIIAMIRAGLIIITADNQVWDEASLDSHRVHVLIGIIMQAHGEMKRHSEKIKGGQTAKREAVRKFVAGETTVMPRLNRTFPWLNEHYKPIADRVRIIRQIFKLCLSGMSDRMIVVWLNTRLNEYPVFGGRKNHEERWTISRIYYMLRDERLLGWVTIKEGKAPNWHKAPPALREQIMPKVIGDSMFQRTQDTLAARSFLRGNKGKGGAPSHDVNYISNLFTGKAFCECGAKLTVAGAGLGKHGEKPYKVWRCVAAYQGKCEVDMHYPIKFYEHRILAALLVQSPLAPRGRTADTEALADKLARTQRMIANQRQQIDRWENDQIELGFDTERADRIDKNIRSIGVRRKDAETLERQIADAKAPTTRSEEIAKFIGSHVGTALQGNLESRDKLRGVLATVDYKIVGTAEGLVVQVPGHKDTRIEPGLVVLRQRADRVKVEVGTARTIQPRGYEPLTMYYAGRNFFTEHRVAIR
jgi:DNA invertase Pin-like site-specific DNA recombinase